MSLIPKALVIVGVGAILWMAAQHVRDASSARPAAGPLPISVTRMAPIPGLDPEPRPISENLHPLDRTPHVTVLDTSDAKAAAARSRSHEMDQRLGQYSPTASPIPPPRR
jgi:hypothetical protein